MQEFKITLREKFAHLDGEYRDSLDILTDNLTTAITKWAAAFGKRGLGKHNWLSNSATMELIVKGGNKKLSSYLDPIEQAELSK